MARANGHSVVLGHAFLFGSGGILVALLGSTGLLNARLSYAALTLLLLSFLWLQVGLIRHRHPQRWLLNPAVVGAFLLFTMAYGVSNVLYFLPPETVRFPGIHPDVSPAMVTQQHLALLGAIMLYLGYWSRLATSWVRPHAVARFQRRYLPASETLQPLSIPILFGVAIVARLFAMSQGIYGFGGDYSAERLAQTSSYSQYIALLGGLGKLALLLAALQYFAPGGVRRGAQWFWVALLIEIFFGLLSGMKSAVVMPMVIAGVAMYLRTGRVPMSWVAIALVGIMVAYAVIEPFRDLRKQQEGALTSVTETTSVLEAAIETDRSTTPATGPGSTLLSVLKRMNFSYIGSLGIEYADARDTLPASSPAFLEDLFLAPLHAVVPRFIWESKPSGGKLGAWYAKEVTGRFHEVSIAMGPFTYLYFAGGYAAVGVFFFFIGVIQRVLWFRLTAWANVPGAVVMLGLLTTVAVVNSSVNSVIISLIREGIMLLVVVNLLFRPHKIKNGPNNLRAYPIGRSL
jgi:hypothetical protein